MKKIISIVLVIVVTLSLGTPAFAATDGWQRNNSGWWYRNADGTYPKGWYVARLEVEVWDNEAREYKWLYSDSCDIGQHTTLKVDSDKYEIDRVGYQIWFFGWNNDYMNLPWSNTDYATVFYLSGSGDNPEFDWKTSSSYSPEK
ncbi:MAG: hypothetical protein IKF90_12005 [Parasporobacterium sp.]|nr:hypothetical protein [Parasporobacterium sp.]